MRHKRQYLLIFSFLISLGCASVFEGSVLAQANLQNTTGSLQQSSTQTQETQTNLNQTQVVQQSNGQAVLNENGFRSLGVVSDPKKTAPEVVVAPSSTSENIVDNSSKSHPLLFLIAGLLFIGAFVGAYFLVRDTSPKNKKVSSVNRSAVDEPVIVPEPIKPPRQKRAKKKRKKSNQR